MRRRKYTQQAEALRAPRPRRPVRLRFTSPRALLALALLSLAAAAGIALAASGSAAPTITSYPAALTSSTSASFTYTDSQSPVTYQCNLDGAGWSSCPASGITYPGPLAEGSHTFSVVAIWKGKASTATSYAWVIDTTPPTMTLTFPANGGTYGTFAWGVGCSGGAGLCGSVRDPHGVKSLVVSIRQGSGNWWGGSSFNKTSETFNSATLASPGENSTAWRYPLSLPADGSYTVHVRATDGAANTTSAAAQLSSTFTIVTTPPPPPSITSSPPETTESKEATFAFTDSKAGVTFVCSRDGGDYSSCTSPKTYTSLGLGSHTFSVRALDAAWNVSSATTYSWTVVKTGESHTPFAISGNLSAPLAPGVSRSLQLTITNPNSVAIYVTSLLVSVQTGSSKAGCDGPTNLQVTQSNVSATNAVTVPAKGQATLPAGTVSGPQVLMKDLATNQDACKGATFTFSYTGSAHS
jgi:hypothetical protein